MFLLDEEQELLAIIVVRFCQNPTSGIWTGSHKILFVETIKRQYQPEKSSKWNWWGHAQLDLVMMIPVKFQQNATSGVWDEVQTR